MEQILESLSVLFIPPWRDSTATLVWCAYGAALLILFYLMWRRAVLGKGVRKLMEEKCFTAESAKSAEELGFSPKLFPKGEKLVERVEEGQEVRYFLPEDRMKKAAYLMKATGIKPKTAVLVVIAAYAVMVLAYYFGPSLLEIFEELSPFTVKTPVIPE